MSTIEDFVEDAGNFEHYLFIITFEVRVKRLIPPPVKTRQPVFVSKPDVQID